MRKPKKQAFEQQARQAEFVEREKRAVWASADVVTLRNRGSLSTMDNRQVVPVELRLLVQPPEGESYQAVTTWLVDSDAVAQVQPGQSLSVKIDQQDAQLIYPNVSWATYLVR